MRKKTICLLRVSTNMQETVAQRTEIERYVKEHNIFIDEFIEEDGVSGFKTRLENRKGLMKIKEMAENEEIDTLIVFNSDRIGRRMEMAGFVSFLDECGVKILSVTEGYLNQGEDTDDLLNAIKFWNSNYESKKTSKRVKAGKRAKALKGEFLGGVPNFGYRLGDKRLVIDEEESKVVQLLFDAYIKYGTSAVLELFTEKGIKKRGQEWTNTKVNKTLKNTIYIGKKPLNNGIELPQDESLRIVSDEVFNKAQQLLKARRVSRNSEKKFTNTTDALLEGLVYHECADGKIRKLHVDYNRNNSGYKLLYRCSHCKSVATSTTKKVQKSYGGKSVNEKIEKEVINIMENIKYQDVVESFLQERQSDIQSIEKEIRYQNDLLTKKNKVLNNAYLELEKIFMEESCLSKESVNNMIVNSQKDIVNIKQEINNLEEKILTIKSEEINEFYKNGKYKEFRRIYNSATFIEKKMLLQQAIDKVIYFEDRIEIYLNMREKMINEGNEEIQEVIL
ncbi:recombinase family protein [Terrisporobacter hibernicus]|uniref:Recombinase family protein n=1 Tax=Terrisporobacter hibernicus TaxID=2813371 RepID=A0AAX2ZG12_9FIRM|nr:recombinase family protein [Terrisporobacter hibernicus]UEL48284.1 recombinase family protein [Terrisporobacter hibernicus]